MFSNLMLFQSKFIMAFLKDFSRSIYFLRWTFGKPEVAIGPEVKLKVILLKRVMTHDKYRVLEFYLELENSWAGFG